MTITSYDPRANVDLPSESVPADHPLPAWVALLAPAAELAETIANTEFVPEKMRGRPAAITAVILYGFEINVGPLQALGSIDVIQGKPVPSAELLRALIYQAGHDMWVVEATGTRVTVGGRRYGSPRETTITWTSEMARAAGLTGKDSWKKYPRAMLMARATSELAKAVFPDAIHGLGTLDDSADIPIADVGTPDQAAAANVATMRRSRRRTTTPETPQERPLVDPAYPAAGRVPDATSAHTDDAAPVGTTEPPPSVPPAPSGDTAAGAVTRDQLARMNIAFRELDVTDRDHRLLLASKVVGRALTSSQELTADEASRLITELEQARDLGMPLPTANDDTRD